MPYRPSAAKSSASAPKKPESLARSRSCVIEALTWSASGRNVSVRSRFTPVTAAATLLARDDGDAEAVRTRSVTPDGGRLRCASGQYIVGGTGSLIER